MSRRLQRLLYIALGLLIVIVIYSTSTANRELSLVEKAWRDLISPIQRGLSAVGNGIVGAFNYVGNIKNAASEVQKLRTERAKMEFELARLREIEEENIRLKELLGFKGNSELDLVPARVVGRDPRAWLKTIVLDKGEKQGVEIGLPIVTYSGLVGQVTSVTAYTAQVSLLVDPKTAVGGIVQRTRDFVIVDNADTKGYLRVTPLYQKENENYGTSSLIDWQEGDVVITSGVGSMYPKGLMIGTITSLTSSVEGIVGNLTPSVDFRRLEEVFILYQSRTDEVEEGRDTPQEL